MTKKNAKYWIDKVKVLSKVIVVRVDGRILTIKRSDKDRRRPGCWDFPGGNFEKGEHILRSAEREVMEEVGIKVSNLRPVLVDSGMGPNIDGVDVIAVGYVADDYSGDVELSGEHVEYRWVTKDEFLGFETGDDGGFLKKMLKAWKE